MNSQKHERKLLIVDDDPVLLEYLCKFFESNQFTVSVAADAHAAYQQMKESMPDALLLDIILPDLNGLELMNLFQHQLMLNRLPVFLMSVLSQQQVQDLGYRFGAVDFISKPFVATEALKRIESRIG